MANVHPAAIDPSRSGSARLPQLLNGLLLGGLLIHALVSYSQLPDRIPVHFDGAGRPDGWVDKSWGNWLALALTAIGLTLLLIASARLIDWARRNPRFLSLPHKELFLALPDQQQAPIWQRMKNMLYWICVPMNGLFAYAQIGIQQMATDEVETLPLWPMLALMAAMGALVVTQTIGLVRAVKRAVGKA